MQRKYSFITKIKWSSRFFTFWILFSKLQRVALSRKNAGRILEIILSLDVCTSSCHCRKKRLKWAFIIVFCSRKSIWWKIQGHFSFGNSIPVVWMNGKTKTALNLILLYFSTTYMPLNANERILLDDWWFKKITWKWNKSPHSNLASLHIPYYLCTLSPALYGTHIWVSAICITISLTPNLLLEERKVCS